MIPRNFLDNTATKVWSITALFPQTKCNLSEIASNTTHPGNHSPLLHDYGTMRDCDVSSLEGCRSYINWLRHREKNGERQQLNNGVPNLTDAECIIAESAEVQESENDLKAARIHEKIAGELTLWSDISFVKTLIWARPPDAVYEQVLQLIISNPDEDLIRLLYFSEERDGWPARYHAGFRSSMSANTFQNRGLLNSMIRVHPSLFAVLFECDSLFPTGEMALGCQQHC